MDINTLSNDKTYPLQCDLSKNDNILTFMIYLFIYYTKILYTAIKNILLQSSKPRDRKYILKIIIKIYQYTLYSNDDKKYIAKPGIVFNENYDDVLNKDTVIYHIIRYIDRGQDEEIKSLEDIVRTMRQYPLSTIMGSLYGPVTDQSLFLLIYTLYLQNDDIKKLLHLFTFQTPIFI